MMDNLLIEILDESDLVELEVAEAARADAQAAGTDLASQLLLRGAVAEADLLDALAAACGLEPASRDDFGSIDPDALGVIDEEVLRHRRIIPFRKHRHTLGVYVVEPLDDEALAELSETYDVRLNQCPWPELRYLDALASLMGEALPEWAAEWLAGEPVRVALAERAMTEAIVDQPARLAASQATSPARPTSADELPDDLGVDLSHQQVLDFIGDCYDRDALLKVLLGYASGWLGSRMVLVLGKTTIQPYLIDGWPELPDEYRDLEALRKIRLDIGDAPIFRTDQIGHFVADKPEEVGLDDLFVELALFPPDRLLNLSVRIGDRPTMLLLGEPRDRTLPAVERLEAAAAAVGSQLETMVRLAKSGELPPPGQRIPAVPEPEGADEPEPDDQPAFHVDDSQSRIDLAALSEAMPAAAASVSRPADAPEDGEAAPPAAAPADSVRQTAPGVAAPLDLNAAAPTADGDDAPSDADDDDGGAMAGFAAASSAASEADQPVEPESDIRQTVKLDAGEGSPRHTQQLSDPRQTVQMEGAHQTSLGAAASSEAEDTASATAFGIPFVDGEASEAEESEPGEDVGSTAFGAPFVDQAEPDEKDADEEPDEQAGQADAEPAEQPRHDGSAQPRAPRAEDDYGAAGQTLLGGFDAIEELAEASRARAESEAEAARAEEEARAEEADEADEEQPAKKAAPMAMIIRPRAIKNKVIEDPEGAEEDSEEPDDDLDFAMPEVEVEPASLAERSSLPTGISEAELHESSVSEASVEVDRVDVFNSRPQTLQIDLEPVGSDAEAEPADYQEPEHLASDGPMTLEIELEPMEQISGLDVPSSVVEDLADALERLDSTNPGVAFQAAKEMVNFEQFGAALIKDRFPGRLFVDRYQYTVETMPPVQEHGPVLAAVVEMNRHAVPLVTSFLDHPSNELRFYATYLFTKLPTSTAMPLLAERLFDRDQQTREVARRLVAQWRDHEAFEDYILDRIRKEFDSPQEDFRLEVAISLLGFFRDRFSVPMLIEGLTRYEGRTRQSINRALRQITYKDFVPSPTEWRNWWADAASQKRAEWVVAALNAESDEIRQMVFKELKGFDQFEQFNYHPDQPPKMRRRAQQELRDWFELSIK